MLSRLLSVLSLTAVAATGCLHTTTKVPGVLDMRTDGSGAASRTVSVKDPELAREGFGSFLWGSGVQGTKEIAVEDRKWWIIDLIPMFNESATEEIKAGLGSGAIRNVKIGDQLQLMDVGLSVAKACACLLPYYAFPLSFTATFTGTPIDVGVRSESTAVPAPAPEAAPAPVPAPAPVAN